MTDPGTRIAIVCSACGSDDVTRDAIGEWSVAEQSWKLRTILDDTYCNRCDTERRLVAVDLAPA